MAVTGEYSIAQSLRANWCAVSYCRSLERVSQCSCQERPFGRRVSGHEAKSRPSIVSTGSPSLRPRFGSSRVAASENGDMDDRLQATKMGSCHQASFGGFSSYVEVKGTKTAALTNSIASSARHDVAKAKSNSTATARRQHPRICKSS